VFSSRELGQNSGNCYNLYITVGGPKDKGRFFTAFANHLIRTLFWGLNLQISFLSRKDSYSRIACERRRSVCRLIHEWPQHIPIHTFNLNRQSNNSCHSSMACRQCSLPLLYVLHQICLNTVQRVHPCKRAATARRIKLKLIFELV